MWVRFLIKIKVFIAVCVPAGDFHPLLFIFWSLSPVQKVIGGNPKFYSCHRDRIGGKTFQWGQRLPSLCRDFCSPSCCFSGAASKSPQQEAANDRTWFGDFFFIIHHFIQNKKQVLASDILFIHTECGLKIARLHMKSHDVKAACQCDLADICAISCTNVYASCTRSRYK